MNTFFTRLLLATEHTEQDSGAEALAHDFHGHLAGTEPLHFHRARHFFQPAFHIRLELRQINVQIQRSFERVHIFRLHHLFLNNRLIFCALQDRIPHNRHCAAQPKQFLIVT